MGQLHLIPDWSNLDESFRQAQMWGAAFEYNDFFNMNLVDDKNLLNQRIQMYKSLPRDRSKDTLHGAFYDICINSQDSKIAELSKYRIEQSMEIAQELQIKGVILHTNIIPGFNIASYVDGWLESNESFLRKILNEYKDINIYMENMFDTSPDILAELARRMKDVESFGICFDVAHGNISPTPMEEWFEKLAPYIKHLHINDNDGISDLHRPVGKGKLDWNKFKEQIRQNSIESSILVEVSSCKAAQDSLMYMKKRGIYPFYGDENL